MKQEPGDFSSWKSLSQRDFYVKAIIVPEIKYMPFLAWFFWKFVIRDAEIA